MVTNRRRDPGALDDADPPRPLYLLAETDLVDYYKRLGFEAVEREYAPTRYTDFERAASTPNEVLSVRYDSRANLVARGVIPRPRPIRPYWPEPQPFPGTFVPDPRG